MQYHHGFNHGRMKRQKAPSCSRTLRHVGGGPTGLGRILCARAHQETSAYTTGGPAPGSSEHVAYGVSWNERGTFRCRDISHRHTRIPTAPSRRRSRATRRTRRNVADSEISRHGQSRVCLLSLRTARRGRRVHRQGHTELSASAPGRRGNGFSPKPSLALDHECMRHISHSPRNRRPVVSSIVRYWATSSSRLIAPILERSACHIDEDIGHIKRRFLEA